MKKQAAKHVSAVLSSMAKVVVTVASFGWVHKPEVPQELLKR